MSCPQLLCLGESADWQLWLSWGLLALTGTSARPAGSGCTWWRVWCAWQLYLVPCLGFVGFQKPFSNYFPGPIIDASADMYRSFDCFSDAGEFLFKWTGNRLMQFFLLGQKDSRDLSEPFNFHLCENWFHFLYTTISWRNSHTPTCNSGVIYGIFIELYCCLHTRSRDVHFCFCMEFLKTSKLHALALVRCSWIFLFFG